MRPDRLLVLTAILLVATAPALSESFKLERTIVAFDFKDEGYYKTIPFIAAQGDLFFISDNFDHRILVYRLQGNVLEFLRAIGRAGQGPGDLIRPTDISASADRLAVRDEQGISLFGLDGEFKGRFRPQSTSLTMLYLKPEIYIANDDSRSPDLIHVYDEGGVPRRSFLEKKALHAIRYDIHKGISPDGVERIVFDGVLRASESWVFFLSRRFGDFVKCAPSGKETTKKDLLPLLPGSERAKASENHRMFLDEGFDLIAHNRFIPIRYVFQDAQVAGNRLFLLLDGWDVSEKKWKTSIDFIEVDIESWRVLNTYSAKTETPGESATSFHLTANKAGPIFLARLRIPDEDDRICIFKPVREGAQ